MSRHPIQDRRLSTQPEVGPSPEITRLADCSAWMLQGACAPGARVLGLECERFAVGPDDRLLPYEGRVSIRTLLERLAARFGWQPVLEEGAIVGLTRAGGGITLEAAGQFEFSAPPFATVAEVAAAFRSHQEELTQVSADLGVRFLWAGYNPADHRPDTPVMPRDRYRLMRRNFPGDGRQGGAMLDFTCAVQVSLDFTDAADGLELIRLGHLLTPVLIALFANSSVAGGVDTGWRSWRGRLWPTVDPDRCGAPALVFDPAVTFDDLVAWAWDRSLYFLAEPAADGGSRYRMLDRPMTFRQYVEDGHRGRRATLADWALHLSTLYPDVRPRRQLELRVCDAVPPDAALALPAFVQGLCYDADARRRCLTLLRDGDRTIDRAALREAACRSALDAAWVDGPLREIAREVLRLAHTGVAAQGGDAVARTALEGLEAIVTGDRPPYWHTLAARWAATPSLYALAIPA
ncbi:MAG: glutamate-cysteine ligase [Gemmatimonadota bacterium]